MAVFDYAFSVRAPLAEVAAFHWDPATLARLTPPPMILRTELLEPLAEGSISRFTLWLGPIPMRWVAVHSGVDPARGFTDTQAEGPMKRWVHTHSFQPAGAASTEVREHIEYEHHPGARGVATRMMFNGPALRSLFAIRSAVTRRALER